MTAHERECADCTFCCWAFGIDDVPQPDGTLKRKPPLTSCRHIYQSGCDIHVSPSYPSQCHKFECPYLAGDAIHRPNVFESTLVDLRGDAEGYIPYIPSCVPASDANALIRRTRTLLAAVIVGSRWRHIVVPIDRDKDGQWRTRQHDIVPWLELCYAHGFVFSVMPYD